MTEYQKHVEKWKNCTQCSLSGCRTHVVLLRGIIPCDILFIGEAPGISEDVIGSPFVGPAGHLLDAIIGSTRSKLRFAFTNLLACLPLDESGSKVKEPPEESIKACAPRLQEIVAVCKPKLIVCVGQLPNKWLDRVIPHREAPSVQITHPAAILRMEGFQQGLATQQVVVILRDAFAGLD